VKIQFESKDLVVFESAIFRTTSILFASQDFILLLDPNYTPSELDFIKAKTDAFGNNKPLYIIFTHSDYDHIVCLSHFNPDKIILSKEFEHFKEKQLSAVRSFDKSLYIQRKKEVDFPIGTDLIQRDGQTVETPNTKLTFYEARGHTKDGILTLVEPNNLLFVGDHLSNIEFPFIEDGYEEYLDTLDKIEKIVETKNIEVLVVGHGDCILNKTAMILRVNESRDYILSIKNAASNDELIQIEDKLLQKYPFFEAVKEHHDKNVKTISNLEI